MMEMVAAHQVRRGLLHQRGNCDVAPFFRIFGDDDIAHPQTEAADFICGRRGFHQLHVRRDVVVVVNVGVVAEANRQFVFGRNFVHVAHPTGRGRFQPLHMPMLRHVAEPFDAAGFGARVGRELHAGPPFRESQRDSVLQPRVARHELPWVNRVKFPQPQWGCVQPPRMVAIVLIPHVSFIPFHSMFPQQCPELVLKRGLPMVFLLSGDIIAQGVQVRCADGKDAVTSLPGKIMQRDVARFDPNAGDAFEFLDPIRLGDGASVPGEQVNMVRDPARKDGRTIELFRCAGEVGVQFRAESGIIEKWSAVLGREHKVEIDGG